MAFIIKLTSRKDGDFYLEWSTVVDAPITYGMRRGDFEDYYRQQNSERVMTELAARMERVEQTGSSTMNGDSARDLIYGNRAGPNERSLHYWEIYRAYCLRQPIRNGWLPE